MVAIGIDLGGTNIKAALIDQQKGVLSRLSVPTEADSGKNHVFNKIASLVKNLSNKSDEKPIGIGIGLPGMVMLDRRTVKHPPNLSGWKEENVASEIEERTGMRTVIENDANLAALGSLYFGVAKEFDSFILITLGTGVGGGIVYNRELFRGSTGAAAELGHVIIDYHGPLSNSNTRGGIEAYLGQRFLSRFAADTIRQHPENSLYKIFHKNFDALEPVELTKAAENGNEIAIQILEKAGQKLGYAIVNYIHMMDIRKIVVSGGVSNAGKWILDPAKKAALQYLMPPFHDGFELIRETLGNEAALLGAAGLALSELK